LVVSPNPAAALISIFLTLSVAAFSVVIGTTSLKSLSDGALERDFLAHEASLGVHQTCECLARMLIDLVPGAMLPLLFSQPFLGFTASDIHGADAMGLFMMITWVYTGIGYAVSMLFPGNAAVMYVAIAFTLSTFASGNFGLTVMDVVTSPGLQPPWVPCFTPDVCNGIINSTVAGTDGYHDAQGYGIFEALPGFWVQFAVQLLWAHSLPQALTRGSLLFDMQRRSGFMPTSNDYAAVYMTREVRWLSAAVYRLFIHGLAVRVLALLVFVIRNYTLAELWQRLCACMPRLPVRFQSSSPSSADKPNSGPVEFVRRHITRKMPRASRMPAPSGTARARAEVAKSSSQGSDAASLDA